MTLMAAKSSENLSKMLPSTTSAAPHRPRPGFAVASTDGVFWGGAWEAAMKVAAPGLVWYQAGGLNPPPVARQYGEGRRVQKHAEEGNNSEKLP
jgi:hypothetical protein